MICKRVVEAMTQASCVGMPTDPVKSFLAYSYFYLIVACIKNIKSSRMNNFRTLLFTFHMTPCIQPLIFTPDRIIWIRCISLHQKIVMKILFIICVRIDKPVANSINSRPQVLPEPGNVYSIGGILIDSLLDK